MRRILIALTAVIAVAAAILAPVDTCAQSIQRGNMRSVSGGMLQRRAKAAANASDEALRAAVDSLVRMLPEGRSLPTRPPCAPYPQTRFSRCCPIRCRRCCQRLWPDIRRNRIWRQIRWPRCSPIRSARA